MIELKKKKIAVLISGQYRNLDDNIESIFSIKNYFNLCDFYLATWDDPGFFDKKKIGNVLEEKTGILIPYVNYLIETSSKYSKTYVLGSSTNEYKTKFYRKKITNEVVKRLGFKNFSVREANNEHYEKIDGVSINKSVMEADPFVWRGQLQMLERNYAGMRLIKESNIDYDYILRLQSEVKINKDFKKDFNLLENYDYVYSYQTIFPEIQANSKIFFGKYKQVEKMLNLFEDYKLNISNNNKDYTKARYEEVPIGERYFKIALDKFKINYYYAPLNISIQRQKFFPIKPKWMERKDTFTMKNEIFFK